MRNLGGLCVTVPHKIELAALCDDLGASGRRIGAVNAVRFDDVPDAGPGGARRMVGDNFDGQGYVAGMRAGGFDFAGKRVLQLGAGGGGMAIAIAVAEAGAARTEEHTSELPSLMRISSYVFCWKKKKQQTNEQEH